MIDRNFIIIPALNEAGRITPIIEAVQSADPTLIETERLIVVDNGSTDDTASLASDSKALVLQCFEQGKGYAMNMGAEYAQSLGATILTFLDADLRGLLPDHVTALVEPVVDNRALMTIGISEGRPWLMRSAQAKLLNLSGQRTLRTEVWNSLGSEDLKGWRTEAALNALFRNSSRTNDIEYVSLSNLKQYNKFQKEHSVPAAISTYVRLLISSAIGTKSARVLRP